ncbi:hypothetical protein A5634_09265 [Mycobacterium asiaticum]|uniref:PknH-like extracellular domain-containing protein n=1 Tax=Mycobacterium asiaticum TaxID=1790 RepID=A0A1A3NKA3_MYCAS|nr:sensor domain-containing protein [Mycobacterium asiaticum]OBK21770.1 hypothetical protein A5634_09265 [Mycobacterium asiaticum]
MFFARAVAVLILGLSAVGCTGDVDGTAQRVSPRSGTTTTPLLQIMPTDEEIRAAVGNDLQQNPPPRTGGIELLPDGFRSNRDASPIECIGPANPALHVVYEKGPVRDVAVQDYWNYGLDVAASGATAAAVRLATVADAQRLFESFVPQWQNCIGTTVTMSTLDSSKTQWYARVDRVQAQGSMLSATVMSWDSHQTPPSPVERAVGVQSDVIVDVHVALRPDVQTSSRATDLVKAMLRKLSGTS